MPNAFRTIALAAIASTTAVTCSILAAPAIFAQDGASQPPGIVDASRVAAGTYSLDPSHTLVGWRVNHFGFNDYFGIFGDVSGTMTMDPANISDAKFEIMVPIADVTVAAAGLKEHLLRPGKDGAAPDFFGPAPGMAKFTSSSVTRTSDTTANVSGMLEMNGKTGPVTLLVEFTGAGSNPFNKKKTVGFEARGAIDRTDWGVNYGQGLIGSEVELNITAAFEMQDAM